jgi:hypothetical protein
MKNIYRSIKLGLLLCAGSFSMMAQSTLPCATTEFTNQLRAKYPQLQTDFDNYNQSMTTVSHAGERTTTTYIVPVVFHVMHVNGVENISDATIFAQMNRLNTDYRKLNSDTSSIVGRFDTLASDVNIEFRLAQIDPNGNCTNGIERIYTHKTFQADDESKLNQWPRDKYLNIWVVHDIAGSTSSATILGFAHFPSDVAGPLFVYDGIIAVYNTIGGSSRTLTHEIGHYLNLLHPWGSTNDPGVACGDDLVDDTPITKGHFSTCPLLDAACTLNPFTANFKFDSVTTSSGNIDPTVNDPLTAITATAFKAVGVSSNSSTNGKFEFSDWGLGAPNGATTFASLTGSINTSKYYEVKFTPQYGYNMKYTQINFAFSRNATGVRTFAVRSSRDGFAANLATASVATADAANMSIQTGNIFFLKNDTTLTVSSGKITLSGTLFTNDTMPVTFRIYAWNAEDAAGTFALDSVNFIGSSDLIENTQNYMDYSSCTNMFTKSQVLRMRNAIESSVSHRNNLWSAANLAATGVLTPQTCKPYPDFYSNRWKVCAGDIVKFTKNVMYGTPDSVRWNFYGGTPSTSTSTAPVNVTYSTPGFYKVSLTAYNSAGTDSVVKTNFIEVNPGWSDFPFSGSFTEDFENTTNYSMYWDVKNYDSNANTWNICTTGGYLSSKSVVMAAFGDYQYDVDDLTSPSYDLSFTSGVAMTFRCAAASHAGAASEVNDVLNVYVSVNCGQTWSLRGTFSDSTLINNGYSPAAFYPTSSTVWTLRTVTIPGSFASSNTRFKFEYTAGAESNNVYIDDINLSGAVGINENNNATSSLSIFPNPTNQSSTISYRLDKKSSTKIEVVDVLGKVAFTQVNAEQSEGEYSVMISKQNLNLKNGIYFVKFTVNDQSVTKKLIVTQ